MRVLVILSRIPYPLEKGDKLRAYEQLKILAEHYEIHLVCLHHGNKIDQRTKVALSKVCHHYQLIKLNRWACYLNLVASVFRNQPLQVGYFYNQQAHRQIEELIVANKIEHIYCQLIRTTEYVKKLGINKTLDYMDALSKGMYRRYKKSRLLLKPIYYYEYGRLKSYETSVFNHFNNHTIITATDKSAIEHPNNHQIKVIPNGVNAANYKAYQHVSKKTDLVFAGNMQYPPNIDAAIFLAHEIMPIVWQKLPDAKLTIAGATPTKKVMNLQHSRIHVTGWVEDMLEVYAQSKVFVAPMRLGSGLQNKLLEAMSMKLPCITTPLANQPLKAENNSEVMIGKDAQEFAEHIIAVLQNDVLANSLAEQGHAFIKKNYNWQQSTQVLMECFSS